MRLEIEAIAEQIASEEAAAVERRGDRQRMEADMLSLKPAVEAFQR